MMSSMLTPSGLASPSWIALAPVPTHSPSPTMAPPPRVRRIIPSPVTLVDATVDPTAILDQLVAEIAGVRSAIVASVDGFGLARSSSMSDAASHPAMLAAAVGLAHQLVVMGGGDTLRQLVVDHDAGLLLVWPIGPQRVLAVLADTTIEQRRLHSFVQARGARLAGVDP